MSREPMIIGGLLFLSAFGGACADSTPPPEEEQTLAAGELEEADLSLSSRQAGCTANVDCRRGFVCDIQSCESDRGVCVPEGYACNAGRRPECGCDGVTYQSRCERIRSGVGLAERGTCDSPPPPDFCGGIAGFVCDEGEVCRFAEGSCGEGDQAGTCVERPEVCTTIFDPVCGCDGLTYGNECEALRAGISVAHEGECEGQVCGGIVGAPCDEGEFCNLPPGSCQTADMQGTCVPRGDACTLELDPVCGCDGVTYSNDCFRIMAGMQKDHDGACSCEPPCACCDPAEEPGQNGNPFCIEGATCCTDGTWRCNEGDGSNTCPDGQNRAAL